MPVEETAHPLTAAYDQMDLRTEEWDASAFLRYQRLLFRAVKPGDNSALDFHIGLQIEALDAMIALEEGEEPTPDSVGLAVEDVQAFASPPQAEEEALAQKG